jgi:hypothetical protein
MTQANEDYRYFTCWKEINKNDDTLLLWRTSL